MHLHGKMFVIQLIMEMGTSENSQILGSMVGILMRGKFLFEVQNLKNIQQAI